MNVLLKEGKAQCNKQRSNKSLKDLLIFVVIVVIFAPRGRRIFNCGFARDVMAAMLMFKNKLHFSPLGH